MRLFLALMLAVGCGSKQQLEKAEKAEEEFQEVVEDTKFLLHHSPDKYGNKPEPWAWPDVRFFSTRHEIAYEQAPPLNELAKYLKDNPSVVLEITGHADQRGAEGYNLELSRKRAHAVRDYMIREGAEYYQFLIAADGETRPRTMDNSKEGLAMNRRVEVSAGPR